MKSARIFRHAFFAVSLLCLAAVSYGGELAMVTGNAILEKCLFSGRWDHEPGFSRTSAPAAMLQFNAVASAATFDLEGESHWVLFEDSRELETFETSQRTQHMVKLAGDGENHRYRLVKASETNPGSVRVYGIALDKSGAFGKKPVHFNRRIEFIGDSFTVGFGDEGNSGDDPSLVFEKTNCTKSYAFLLADGFKADFQVNAFSGRGLVRNYDNIVPEWPVPRLYEYTVPGEAPADLMTGTPDASLRWNFDDFHPQVVVIFMGINDFQGNPPYANKNEFKKAYSKLLNDLRKAHPGVKFVLVSTKVWPNDDLTPTIKSIYEAELANGKRDVEYINVQTDNVGLLGHPDVHSQAELARTLRPLVARQGGWLSR